MAHENKEGYERRMTVVRNLIRGFGLEVCRHWLQCKLELPMLVPSHTQHASLHKIGPEQLEGDAGPRGNKSA